MTLTSVDTNQLDQQLLEQKQRRIHDVKYKVYLLILLVGRYALWPMFISTLESVRWADALGIILSSSDTPLLERFTDATGEWGMRNEIATLDTQIQETQEKIQQSKTEQTIINRMDTPANSEKILACLNNDECSDLPPALQKNLPLLRTYMIVDELESKKMDFDQKLLLQNINEFLLKNVNGTKNGSLLSITFGEPKLLNPKERVYKLPLTLKVEFEHKTRVLSFLRNVEKRVTLTSPIYYTIESMNYDIVNYGTRQQVDITMNAYFYQGK